MKRVVAKAGRAIIIDVPEPELRPGEVLVATAFSAISSGTEMHIIHSTANPETLGDDTYPRKPSLQYPAPPQLRSRGVRWAGPEPRGQIPETASVGYSLSGRVLAVSPEVTDLKPGDRVACSGNQCAIHAERVAPRNLVAKVPEESGPGRLRHAGLHRHGRSAPDGLPVWRDRRRLWPGPARSAHRSDRPSGGDAGARP
jgi:hypothetical protein